METQMIEVPKTFGALILLVLSLLFFQADAQNAYRLSGSVKDKQGSALTGCTVFLNGTKLITSADGSGAFLISDVPPGSYDLVAKMIGFKTAVEHIVIRSSPVERNIVLETDSHLLNEVVIN